LSCLRSWRWPSLSSSPSPASSRSHERGGG
jgi:hypothetical protein